MGDVTLTDASGSFRVEAIDPERSLVLAIRDADAVVSCTIMLAPLDPAHTRLIFRLRLRVARSLRGLGFLLVSTSSGAPKRWATRASCITLSAASEP